MNKPTLRFMVLAAAGTSLLACSITSSDPGVSSTEGSSSASSGSGGSPASGGGSTIAPGRDTAPSGNASAVTSGVTSGAGGSTNHAQISSSSSGTGGVSGTGGAKAVDEPDDSTLGVAGAAGDTGGVDDPVDEPPAIPELVISEYVEGSSNNKAVEISFLGQGVGALMDCNLELYRNGSSEPNAQIPLGVSIVPGDPLVLCHTSSDDAILERCDVESGNVNFNGDDALVVRCGDEVVDSFGRVGELPDLGYWGAAGVVTEDQTLRRICKPEPRTDPSAPFAPEEYFVVAAGDEPDIFDDLGTYNCQ